MKDYLTAHMIALFSGIIIDILIGDPHCFPHPVRMIGKLISFLDRRLNVTDGRNINGVSLVVRGAVMWVIVTISAVGITAILHICAYKTNIYLGLFFEILLTYCILAAGSLRDESMEVYAALGEGEDSDKAHKTRTSEAPGGHLQSREKRINNARMSLSMIVGRDTDNLDESGIIRAAVETVSENTSDGVTAPLIYTAIGGPVLGMLYKAVSTMDSMVGYHNDRYEYFGKLAAGADDVFNYFPSRISALFMVAAAYVLALEEKICAAEIRDDNNEGTVYDAGRSFDTWRRDRLNHKSPNSAQTESACAGALGIRLGGPAYYGGVLVQKPFIGDDIRPVESEDIKRALRLMFCTEAVCTAVIYTIMTLILIFR